jgi:hypothetical protein
MTKIEYISTIIHTVVTLSDLIGSTVTERVVQIVQMVQLRIYGISRTVVCVIYSEDQETIDAYASMGFEVSSHDTLSNIEWKDIESMLPLRLGKLSYRAAWLKYYDFIHCGHDGHQVKMSTLKFTSGAFVDILNTCIIKRNY